jgi:hypothetical protein
MTATRTYSELIELETFEERFRYLALRGSVGVSTFGFDRYINQAFYRSREWKDIRRHVILRDEACDLAVEGFDIHAEILVHHMNPIVVEDISDRVGHILHPEYLITTTHKTHNAIHYGDESLLPRKYSPRAPGDTQLWKRRE